MALSLTTIESIFDKLTPADRDRLLKKYLTVESLPMSDIMKWLEQHWSPDANALLYEGSITIDKLAGGIILPRAKFRGSATNSIANGGGLVHALNLTTEVFDVGNMWSGGDPSKLTAPNDGLYWVWTGMQWDSNTTGIRDISIRVNGGSLPVFDRHAPPNAAFPISASGVWLADAGDYFESVVQQTSGGSLNVNFSVSYAGLAVVCLASQGVAR